MDYYLLKRRIGNQHNIVVYGGGFPRQFFKPMETNAIHVARALNLNIQNILPGENFDWHIKRYDTEESACVFVNMALDLINNPVIIYVTIVDQIQRAKSQKRKLERNGIIEPFIRFMVSKQRSKEETSNVGNGFSAVQTKIFTKKLLQIESSNEDGLSIKVNNCEKKFIATAI